MIDMALFETLTLRERELLVEKLSGKTNAQVGASLGISTHTVESSVQRIGFKLHRRQRGYGWWGSVGYAMYEWERRHEAAHDLAGDVVTLLQGVVGDGRIRDYHPQGARPLL